MVGQVLRGPSRTAGPPVARGVVAYQPTPTHDQREYDTSGTHIQAMQARTAHVFLPSFLSDISRPDSPLVRVCGAPCAVAVRSRKLSLGLFRTSLAQEGVLVHVHAQR